MPGAAAAAEATELAAAAVAIEMVSDALVEVDEDAVVVEEEEALMDVVDVVGWAGFVNEEDAVVLYTLGEC